MSEPVKLSRERWEMLARYMAARQMSPCFANVAASRSISLSLPIESEGVIFLPAEYVPAPDPRDDRPNPLLTLIEAQQPLGKPFAEILATVPYSR